LLSNNECIKELNSNSAKILLPISWGDRGAKKKGAVFNNFIKKRERVIKGKERGKQKTEDKITS
jgi:hypothetical protein